ncbi:hypothetical protein Cni_G00492 [Canna indica]|uniref:Nodulin-like domain-containing protein n=1 Tax=Canna indica TaxID=4628 RepID=A0AAQ3JLD3_9LILI|nr:hypothetical protein Cni_G00492 [Canna indica]
MFFSSILVQAAAGGSYIFGIYSNDIKSSLGYDQSTLNTLSFFKDLGANVGIIAGLVNEVLPPWGGLAIGASMNLVGYLMIYLSVTGRTAPPPVWLMCLYICVGANSQTFANTCSLVTCVKNFPESRGVVLGLLKGWVGLSGAIMTQLYQAIYGDDSKSLILLVAWLPAAVSFAFSSTIRIMKVTPTPKTPKAFYFILYISICLAVFLMAVIIWQKRVTFSHAEFSVSASVTLLLLFLPLAVVIKEELKTFNQNQQTRRNPKPLSITVVNPSPAPESEPSSSDTSPKKKSAAASCATNMFTPPNRGEDYTIPQALVSVDMILLFVATICGVGGTLTAIDNMGQIGQSLGYPKQSVSTFVSLTSIWNYAGRVFAGFVSEILLTKFKLPRPLMLSLVLFFSCFGHLLIASGYRDSIYFASVINGFCFGAQWPLLFAIISEIFGLKYYSTLYNFGAVASPIGSYILNVKVAGNIYDKEALKQRDGVKSHGTDLTCVGVRCFRRSFIIIAAATLVGVAASLVLAWRTRTFYRGDIYAKFTEQVTAAENEMATGVSAGSMKLEGEEETTKKTEKEKGEEANDK